MEFKWRAPEFINAKRGRLWFLNLWSAAAASAFIFIALKNYYAAAIAVAAGFTLSVIALKEPKIVNFSIAGEGVNIDGREIKFSEIKNFAVKESPETLDELIFETKKIFPAKVNVIIDPKINIEELKSFLKQFVSEEDYQESLSEFLARILKI